MQRYFVSAEQFADHRVLLNGDEAHHLIRVMRAREGDRIIVSDGDQREALAELTVIAKDSAEAKIIEWLPMDREPEVLVTVAQSLPKGDKLELVIQKGTELGASRFIPFVSERTVVQYDARKEAKRLERWRKIAKEAAEQAHRNRIPQVTAPHAWREIMEMAEQFDMALFCYEKAGGSAALRPLLQQLRLNPPHGGGNHQRKPSILLVVGPEGGFSEREAEEAKLCGFQLVGLGRRILRTETAALAGLACIMYEFYEMGGTH